MHTQSSSSSTSLGATSDSSRLLHASELAEKIQNKGYIRQKIVDLDADPYFVAFQLRRGETYRLILDNKEAVAELLKPAVLEALLQHDFMDCLNQKRLLGDGLIDAEQHAKDPAIIEAYLDYTILKNDRWPHPAILQSLAHIRALDLRLWQEADKKGGLTPFFNEEHERLISNNAQVLDLLLTEDNHFEVIHLFGYEEGCINETIFPLEPELRSRIRTVLKMLGLALPMAMSYTFSWSILAIGIMAGHMSGDKKENLDASTLAMSYTDTLAACSLASLYAISLYASQLRGDLESIFTSNNESEKAKKIREISRVVKSGLVMGTMTLPIPFLLLFFSKFFLADVFGQDEDVAQLAQEYLRPYAFGMVALLGQAGLEQVLFTFEKQNAAMIMALACFALGVGVADVLAFGHLSFPELGFAGIATGFTVEAWLTFLTFGLYVAHAPTFKDFDFFKHFKFTREDLKQLKELLKIGLPITVTTINEILASFVMTLLAGLLGTDELAAQNFSALLLFFTLLPDLAFGQAAGQEVSRELGEKNYKNANRTAIYSLVASMSIIFPVCLAVFIEPRIFVNLMASDVPENVLAMTDILLPITAAGVLSDTVRYNFLQVLRALDCHKMPTLLSSGSVWLGVLLAYLLGFQTDLGITGVTMGYALGLASGALSLLPQWLNEITPEALSARVVELPTETENAVSDASKKEGHSLAFFSSCRKNKEKPASSTETEGLEKRVKPSRRGAWYNCFSWFSKEEIDEREMRDLSSGDSLQLGQV